MKEWKRKSFTITPFLPPPSPDNVLTQNPFPFLPLPPGCPEYLRHGWRTSSRSLHPGHVLPLGQLEGTLWFEFLDRCHWRLVMIINVVIICVVIVISISIMVIISFFCFGDVGSIRFWNLSLWNRFVYMLCLIYFLIKKYIVMMLMRNLFRYDVYSVSQLHIY